MVRKTNKQLVNVFVPTTPNPTSGFYLIVPEDEIYDVDLNVEEAFKMIMSAGLVAPGSHANPQPVPPPPELLPPEEAP